MKEEIENNIPHLKEGNTDRYVQLKKTTFLKIGLYVNSRFQEDRAIPFIGIFVNKLKSIIRYDTKIAIKDMDGKVFERSLCLYEHNSLLWDIGDGNDGLAINGIYKIRLYNKGFYTVDDLIINISKEELNAKFREIRDWQKSIYRKMTHLDDF